MARQRKLTDEQCAEVWRRRRIRAAHADKKIAAELGVHLATLQTSARRYMTQQLRKVTP